MNPLILAWVAFSALGLVLSLFLTWESWHDIVALGSRSNGRRWVARSRFAREGGRITVHWVWLLLGVSVLLDIDMGPMVILGLLYGNFILVVNSLIDARTRTLVYKTRQAEPEIPKP